MGEAQVLVLPSSYYREREGTSRQEVCSWLPPALPWEVGWMLRTARMVFTNGYGGHRKSPGLAVRNFDLILLWAILVASHVSSLDLSFPICGMQRLGWMPMMDASRLIFNPFSCMWEEGHWGVLWPELCPLSSHVDIVTRSISECGCVWR